MMLFFFMDPTREGYSGGVHARYVGGALVPVNGGVISVGDRQLMVSPIKTDS